MAHACLLHDAAGGGVAHVVLRLYAVELHIGETELYDGAQGRGHKPVVPVRAAQGITHLGGMMGFVPPRVTGGAYHMAGFPEHDAPRGWIVRPVLPHDEAKIGFGIVNRPMGRPLDIARHLRIGGERVYVFGVAHLKTPQYQARRLYRLQIAENTLAAEQ